MYTTHWNRIILFTMFTLIDLLHISLFHFFAMRLCRPIQMIQQFTMQKYIPYI